MKIRCGTRRGLLAFTLIEIMVVVIILGVLAATIIPKFIGTTHEAKVSAAKSHVAELESALERFYVNMDRYPTTDEGLKLLVNSPPGEEKKWRGVVNPTHFPPRARRVIHLCMAGGPSHLESLDHKPALKKIDGQWRVLHEHHSLPAID